MSHHKPSNSLFFLQQLHALFSTDSESRVKVFEAIWNSSKKQSILQEMIQILSGQNICPLSMLAVDFMLQISTV